MEADEKKMDEIITRCVEQALANHKVKLPIIDRLIIVGGFILLFILWTISCGNWSQGRKAWGNACQPGIPVSAPLMR